MAKRNSKIPPEELQEILEELQEHYGEPVRPVSDYCDAFETWMRCLEEVYWETLKTNGKKEAERVHGAEIVPHLPDVRRLIKKSNLLARLIYGGEKFRIEKCPVHNGHWDGQAMLMGDCPHKCDGTGFLRAKEDENKA